ncbi:hypothetical protein P154DRAFT_537094 [Amniculicola lignicola CBS 123094]|uniref:Nephrocystin 3-like N-terminal domain-containing protein n=1 Tax=Amniculicola lignicola CBS 123094 TaxID=1392246 RepID=A0A6A5WBN7_9PLEO|nr:hypothetical protein P154DRAFT_537094 [Amniculicola lignicola CBS 123094]
MLWADQRDTKREEDKAYSLFGIFDVCMLLIYGEGKRRAFRRLQKEIGGIRDTESSAIPPALSTEQPRNANPIQICEDDGVTEEAQQRKELLNLLFFDHIDERLLSLKAAHAKTCKWFLEKDIYQAWISADNLQDHYSFLWIKGKPGAGKSTLMKFLVSKAKTSAHSNQNSLVASFFFNARDKLDSNAQRILQNKGWQQEILKHTLSRAVEQLGCRTLQLYIDALDECEDKDVTDMISFFEDLGELAIESNIQLHTCFSSRYYPTVVIRHEKAADLKAQILEKSAGVLLWVALVIPMLNNASAKGRIEELQRCLKDIPPELDNLFEMILMRDQEDLPDLKLCVQWILFAKRPLKQEEYFFALRPPKSPNAVTIPSSEEVSDEDMRRFVDSSSKGLAQVTKTKSKPNTYTVQFIHESVRDFFLLEKGYLRLWPSLSDRFMAHSHEGLRDRCMAEIYGSFGSSALGVLETRDRCTSPRSLNLGSVNQNLPVAKSEGTSFIRQSVSAELPFLGYAVDNVLYHADAAESDANCREIFLREFPLKYWILLNNIYEQHYKFACPYFQRNSQDPRLRRACRSYGFQNHVSTGYIQVLGNVPTHYLHEIDRLVPQHLGNFISAPSIATTTADTKQALLDLVFNIHNQIVQTFRTNHLREDADTRYERHEPQAEHFDSVDPGDA